MSLVTSSTKLTAECGRPRPLRCPGYRFTVSNAADNTELAELLTTDPEATFTGLPSGTKVSVTVTARNSTGESQESDPPVVVVVP
jgi:hypothetical protein